MDIIVKLNPQKENSIVFFMLMYVLKAFVKKVQDKNLLKNSVVRLSRCLQPKEMVENIREIIAILRKFLQELQKRIIIRKLWQGTAEQKFLYSEYPTT